MIYLGSRLRVLSFLAIAIGTLAPSITAQASNTESRPVSIPEVPNSIAVANNGVALTSFFDLQQVAIIQPSGVVSRIDIGCSPQAVAIDPAGKWGWTVCRNNPHIFTIEIASGNVSVASVDLSEAMKISYVSSTQQLIVGSQTGNITVVSATGLEDYRKVASYTVGDGTLNDLTSLAVSSDGSTGYVAVTVGSIHRFDVRSGKTTQLKLASANAYVQSLAMSPRGNVLFAGGVITGSNSKNILLALIPSSAKTVSYKELEVPSGGNSTFELMAGHRVLYGAFGLGVKTPTGVNGAFSVAIDGYGTLGATDDVLSREAYPSVGAISEDRTRVALATTNQEAYVITTTDTPYPADVTISASIRRQKLQLTGRSIGLAPGSRITVFVKEPVKGKPARFVRQRQRITVANDGTFTWRKPATASRLSVYVRSAAVRSNTDIARR